MPEGLEEQATRLFAVERLPCVSKGGAAIILFQAPVRNAICQRGNPGGAARCGQGFRHDALDQCLGHNRIVVPAEHVLKVGQTPGVFRNGFSINVCQDLAYVTKLLAVDSQTVKRFIRRIGSDFTTRCENLFYSTRNLSGSGPDNIRALRGDWAVQLPDQFSAGYFEDFETGASQISTQGVVRLFPPPAHLLSADPVAGMRHPGQLPLYHPAFLKVNVQVTYGTQAPT